MFKPVTNDRYHQVEVSIDGKQVMVDAGISVASALLTVKPDCRTTVVTGQSRGPFCMMGVCFDCLCVINDVPNQQGCQVIVQNGMEVVRQHGAVEDPTQSR